jgi:hypothetical protein
VTTSGIMGPLIKSHAVATAAFRDRMHEARRSQWPFPLASRATKQTARKATVPLGCGKMQCQRRCTPRCRSPGYDLRRAPCIHPHFASNAIRGGLNQRFPNCRGRRNTDPNRIRPRVCLAPGCNSRMSYDIHNQISLFQRQSKRSERDILSVPKRQKIAAHQFDCQIFI